jgi:hypothetical protein
MLTFMRLPNDLQLKKFVDTTAKLAEFNSSHPFLEKQINYQQSNAKTRQL